MTDSLILEPPPNVARSSTSLPVLNHRNGRSDLAVTSENAAARARVRANDCVILEPAAVLDG